MPIEKEDTSNQHDAGKGKVADKVGGPGQAVPMGPQNKDPQGAGGPSEPFSPGTRKHQEVDHAVK